VSEAFGVATLERALGPGIAVGVKCHAPDVQALTALLEFSRAVPGSDGAQIWKEGARRWTAPEEGGDLFPEADGSVTEVAEVELSNLIDRDSKAESLDSAAHQLVRIDADHSARLVY
jgi:hypothetical protein